MWLRNPLDDVLSSKAKVALLRAVCHANAPLSGRELARRAGVWPSAASKALGELTASGILARRDHGSAKTYELADTDVELVRQVRELYRAEAARLREFARDLAEAVPEMRSLILFGSEARGDAGPGSDTDLLIVLKQKGESVESKVIRTCVGSSERFGLALSWHITDLHEIRKWSASSNPFWNSILEDGVTLYGEPPEALAHEWQRHTTS